MSAPITIFNLYELEGGSERYLLAKAHRPSASNCDQVAENEAHQKVNNRLDLLVVSERELLMFSSAKIIGRWEDAWPVGDVFYSNESGVPIDIWMSLDTKYGLYFAFGIADSENKFWDDLKNLYDEGDLWGFDEFKRPAQLIRAWFVQWGTKSNVNER